MRKQTLHPRTEALNRTQKNKSKHSRVEALAWLAQKFPEAFNNKEKISPLKVGIMDDILAFADEALAAGISKSKLREGVVVFTRRLDYLACVKAKEMRIDLYGTKVAAVTEEESQNAALKIRKRVEKSLKNAKKQPVSTTKSASSLYSQLVAAHQEQTSYYVSDKSETSGHSGFSAQNAKAASVVVKHKSPRALDKDALARFKAKLGLAQPST